MGDMSSLNLQLRGWNSRLEFEYRIISLPVTTSCAEVINLKHISAENFCDSLEADGEGTLWFNPERLRQPLVDLPLPLDVVSARWLSGEWQGHDQWGVQVRRSGEQEPIIPVLESWL